MHNVFQHVKIALVEKVYVKVKWDFT